jgi:uncharacterized repeat protein (TIGR03847 family)
MMPGPEIELDPVDFVTIGTVGPKGRRLFCLQAGRGDQVATLVIEKEQARALGEALGEMLESLKRRYPDFPEAEIDFSTWDMSLREPLEPLFRVAQMSLGYDESRNMILMVAQELLASEEEPEPEPGPEPQALRLWATREQMRALSEHALTVVKQGRANPKGNGHLIYYWT